MEAEVNYRDRLHMKYDQKGTFSIIQIKEEITKNPAARALKLLTFNFTVELSHALPRANPTFTTQSWRMIKVIVARI